jgi:hypothetical protein
LEQVGSVGNVIHFYSAMYNWTFMYFAARL